MQKLNKIWRCIPPRKFMTGYETESLPSYLEDLWHIINSQVANCKSRYKFNNDFTAAICKSSVTSLKSLAKFYKKAIYCSFCTCSQIYSQAKNTICYLIKKQSRGIVWSNTDKFWCPATVSISCHTYKLFPPTIWQLDTLSSTWCFRLTWGENYLHLLIHIT